LTAEFRRLRSKVKKVSPSKIGEEINAARK